MSNINYYKEYSLFRLKEMLESVVKNMSYQEIELAKGDEPLDNDKLIHIRKIYRAIAMHEGANASY